MTEMTLKQALQKQTVCTNCGEKINTESPIDWKGMYTLALEGFTLYHNSLVEYLSELAEEVPEVKIEIHNKQIELKNDLNSFLGGDNV